MLKTQQQQQQQQQQQHEVNTSVGSNSQWG